MPLHARGQSLSILNECGTDVPTEKIPACAGFLPWRQKDFAFACLSVELPEKSILSAVAHVLKADHMRRVPTNALD